MRIERVKYTKIVSVRFDHEAAAALEFLQSRSQGINISRFFRQEMLKLAHANGFAYDPRTAPVQQK
jgi:hypothetical protein